MGSILGWVTKIPRPTWHGQKNKKVSINFKLTSTLCLCSYPSPLSSSSYQAYLLSSFPFYFLLPQKPRTSSSTSSGKSPPSLPSRSPSPSPLLQSLPVLITLSGRWEQGCILPISPEQPGRLCFSPTSVGPQSFRPEGSAPGGQE